MYVYKYTIKKAYFLSFNERFIFEKINSPVCNQCNTNASLLKSIFKLTLIDFVREMNLEIIATQRYHRSTSYTKCVFLALCTFHVDSKNAAEAIEKYV